MARQLTISIVSCSERKHEVLSKDWDYVYIPMSEDEKFLYCNPNVLNPCWRIGVQPIAMPEWLRGAKCQP